MTAPVAAVHIRGLVKDYRGLRPLRVAALSVHPGELVTLSGMDSTQASVLVDLITGATLPDAGEVFVAGKATAAIHSQEAWLAFLDQFGIVNPRVVLLDALTVAQNLAVPLTLSVDPLPAPVRAKVEATASEIGLPADLLDRSVSSLDAAGLFRVRLGRALALAPRLVLVEHPTLGIDASHAGAIARDLAALLRPPVALLVLTSDPAVSNVATRALTWQPATGVVQESRGWRGWLGR